jgi:hypothetical protein
MLWSVSNTREIYRGVCVGSVKGGNVVV